MREGSKVLRFKLTILTPVHIGTGQTLSPWDLVKQPDGSWVRVDFEKWLRRPTGLFQGGRTDLDRSLKSRLQSGQITPPEATRLGRVTVAPSGVAQRKNRLEDALEKAGPGGVRPTQREADGRLRIPGTSLKGMLWTAWVRRAFTQWRQAQTDLGSSFEDRKKQWERFARENLSDGAQKFQDSPLAWLGVADLILEARDTCLLEAHRSYLGQFSYDQGDRSINRGWLECIPPGTSGTLELRLNDAFRGLRLQEGAPARTLGPREEDPRQLLLQALKDYSDFLKITQNRALRAYFREPVLPKVPANGIPLLLGAATHNFTKTCLPRLWTEEALKRFGERDEARKNPWAFGRHTLVAARQVPLPGPSLDRNADVPLGWIALEPLEG